MKKEWMWIILGGAALLALGWFINYLWQGASGQPATSWFNRFFSTTTNSTGAAAQGSGGAGPSQPGPVPSAAAVCCSHPANAGA